MKKSIMSLVFVVIGLVASGCNKSSSGGSSTAAAAAVTTCTAGQLYSSQYGCQPSCGTASIWYNNQCLPVGTGTAGANMCQGICPTGYVIAGGGTACLPVKNCGPCQGAYNGTCYQSDYYNYGSYSTSSPVTVH